jgi:hypothetical protein
MIARASAPQAAAAGAPLHRHALRRHVHTRVCRCRCAARASAAAAAAAAPGDADAVCFDLDAVVQGLEPLATAWALQAARAMRFEVAGSPALYAHAMAQLLPVLGAPADATLLLRLLHDEGVVGECVDARGRVPRARAHGRVCVALELPATLDTRTGRCGPAGPAQRSATQRAPHTTPPLQVPAARRGVRAPWWAAPCAAAAAGRCC